MIRFIELLLLLLFFLDIDFTQNNIFKNLADLEKVF